MLNIESIVSIPNKCQEFFKSYNRVIPIILFGAGGGCSNAAKMFLSHEIMPQTICDNDSKKWGRFYEDIPITSLYDAIMRYEDFNIFVSAPNNAHDIIPDLRQKVGEDKIYFFDADTRIDLQSYKKYLLENKDFINSLFQSFKDTLSKQVLENMLKGWISCDYKYFEEIYSSPQYFPKDIFQLSQYETFLDIGAYTGDSIEEFIRQTDCKYKRIIAIEPNLDCKDKLDSIKNQYRDIDVIYNGVFNKSDKILFDNTGIKSTAHFCLDKQDSSIEKCVEVYTIDSLIKEKVTFIKMDIEGLELQALEGAKDLIKEYRPKLAISVYHKTDDIVEIPKFVQNLNLDYTLYLRHHSWYTGETVLYAI